MQVVPRQARLHREGDHRRQQQRAGAGGRERRRRHHRVAARHDPSAFRRRASLDVLMMAGSGTAPAPWEGVPNSASYRPRERPVGHQRGLVVTKAVPREHRLWLEALFAEAAKDPDSSPCAARFPAIELKPLTGDETRRNSCKGSMSRPCRSCRRSASTGGTRSSAARARSGKPGSSMDSRKDLVLALGIVALGVFVIAVTMSFPEPVVADRIGPRAFPFGLGALFLIGGRRVAVAAPPQHECRQAATGSHRRATRTSRTIPRRPSALPS